MDAGIIICSRLSSSRVPGKPLVKYNGKTQIELLIGQLMKTKVPIFLCVPESELVQYGFLMDIFPKRLTLFSGWEDDPLARQYECAKRYGLKKIVRVTHDKIFVDVDRMPKMLALSDKFDYVFSSDFVPGSGFEVFTFDALEAAAKTFMRVEHISYAIKAVTDNWMNYHFQQYRKDVRLLIDFPEDVKLMQVIFATLGTDISLDDVLVFLDQNNAIKHINRLPQVTVYTCAKNADKWIDDAMGSVALQQAFKDYEYILIDDYSNDKTVLKMAKFCQVYRNSKFQRNDSNIGLASSSNVALKQARGKYIVRLDADDFFIGKNVIQGMIDEIEKQDVDAIYPNCYAGLSMRTVQKGPTNHHVGGSLFRTSAINHIKFTDNLRNYDSLDVFLRARERIKIGYYDRVVFCYRQHNESMSKTNLNDREKTRKILESKYGQAVQRTRRG